VEKLFTYSMPGRKGKVTVEGEISLDGMQETALIRKEMSPPTFAIGGHLLG
jgi:hypothetical protein